jgi:hypothetical protein
VKKRHLAIRLLATISVLSLGTAPAINFAQATCLHYGGRIFISGVLTRQVFPGPPGYESITRGDTPEIHYVLKVRPSTCVLGDSSDPDEPAIENATDVQLMLTGRDQYILLEHWIDKPIRLSGTLMAAHTGHHHTPVLLNDVQLEAN